MTRKKAPRLSARGGKALGEAGVAEPKGGAATEDALGKMRGTIKKIADGDPWAMPATIDGPAILDEIGTALKGHGMRG